MKWPAAILLFTALTIGPLDAESPTLPDNLKHLVWSKYEWITRFIIHLQRDWEGVAFDGSYIRGANPGGEPICQRKIAESIPRIANGTKTRWEALAAHIWSETQFQCAVMVVGDAAWKGRKYNSYGYMGINGVNSYSVKSCRRTLNRWAYVYYDRYEKCAIDMILATKRSRRYLEALNERKANYPLLFVMGGKLPGFWECRKKDKYGLPDVSRGNKCAHYNRKKRAIAVIRDAFKEYHKGMFKGRPVEEYNRSLQWLIRNLRDRRR